MATVGSENVSDPVIWAIAISLLHPSQSVPVQSWTFEPEKVVRIGRSQDNDVILHSSVVSRHHLELWPNESSWEVVSFGSNGTYIDNQPITQEPLVDGMVIRLGNTGPKLQINLTEVNRDEKKDGPSEPMATEPKLTPSGSDPSGQIATEPKPTRPGSDPSKDRQTFLTNPNLKRTKPEEPPPTDVDL